MCDSGCVEMCWVQSPSDEEIGLQHFEAKSFAHFQPPGPKCRVLRGNIPAMFHALVVLAVAERCLGLHELHGLHGLHWSEAWAIARYALQYTYSPIQNLFNLMPRIRNLVGTNSFHTPNCPNAKFFPHAHAWNFRPWKPMSSACLINVECALNFQAFDDAEAALGQLHRWVLLASDRWASKDGSTPFLSPSLTARIDFKQRRAVRRVDSDANAANSSFMFHLCFIQDDATPLRRYALTTHSESQGGMVSDVLGCQIRAVIDPKSRVANFDVWGLLRRQWTVDTVDTTIPVRLIGLTIGLTVLGLSTIVDMDLGIDLLLDGLATQTHVIVSVNSRYFLKFKAIVCAHLHPFTWFCKLYMNQL